MCFTPQCLARAAVKDSAVLQFPHLGRAVTEIAGKDQLVVLAKKRGIQGQWLFEIRESKREARQIELTQNPVAHLTHSPPLAQVRMVHRLLYGDDGREGHSIAIEYRHRLFVTDRGKPALDDVYHVLQISHARRIVLEARVMSQFRTFHNVAQGLPLTIDGSDD